MKTERHNHESRPKGSLWGLGDLGLYTHIEINSCTGHNIIRENQNQLHNKSPSFVCTDGDLVFLLLLVIIANIYPSAFILHNII